MKKRIVLGMVGAARGTELHMGGYRTVYGIDLRFKTIFARRERQLVEACEKWGWEGWTTDFNDLINDPEIDLIDICTPPYLHVDEIIAALEAGKSVICEKPLTGYFGKEGDFEPIGDTVPKRKMFDSLLSDLQKIENAVKKSSGKFMYAENFIYAPAIQKAAELITAKKSRILFMKGEESLKGSSSSVAGEWSKTGGGPLIRTGSHPLATILWLKQKEAEAHGEEITLSSVVADMGRVTSNLTDYEHRHIAARPKDVEDISNLILTFSDGTKATVMATDTLLGGSRNYVELYCNDAAINCRLTLSDLMETYMLDEDGLEGITLSEMLPTKTGWNRPFVVDEIIRGYADEIQDFCGCVAFNRIPQSGFRLASETIRAIYAAYLSADEGRRIDL